MPTSGSLAALKDLFSAIRTITASTVLTPADQGRLIVVNGLAPLDVTLPAIGGDSAAGVNGLGSGWAVAILRVGAGDVRIVNTVDTFNGGQVFGPISLTGAAVNNWLIATSPGGTSPGDWSILASIPGAL